MLDVNFLVSLQSLVLKHVLGLAHYFRLHILGQHPCHHLHQRPLLLSVGQRSALRWLIVRELDWFLFSFHPSPLSTSAG